MHLYLCNVMELVVLKLVLQFCRQINDKLLDILLGKSMINYCTFFVGKSMINYWTFFVGKSMINYWTFFVGKSMIN